VTAPTPAERAQVIAGLRELADLLEANPALPVSKYTRMRVSTGDVDMDLDDTDDAACRGAVDAAAATLGRPVTDQHGHYDTTWISGAGEDRYGGWYVQYNVGSIATATMAEHALRQSYNGVIQVTT
jgi:hypothetical protein